MPVLMMPIKMTKKILIMLNNGELSRAVKKLPQFPQVRLDIFQQPENNFV